MAKPRRVIPGATYMITRRTEHRVFRLKPDPLTNQIALYCLAWAASRHGILVYAIVLLSDHIHVVLKDANGLLPKFMMDFHRNMAKALNAAQGQCENLWSNEHAHAVLVPTLDDLVEEVAYIVSNPVRAELVADPSQWPGVLCWEPGGRIAIKRPDVYFSAEGAAPDRVELRLAVPDGVDEREWEDRLRQAIAKRVAEARRTVQGQGRKFAGAARVQATSILARAMNRAGMRKCKPVVNTLDPLMRHRCLAVQRHFERSYAASLSRWKAGDRTVVFPHGTWWMRVHHGAWTGPPTTADALYP